MLFLDYHLLMQDPPASNEESKAVYDDFLVALDLINQQEDLRGSFKGKVPEDVLKEMFVCEDDVKSFPTIEGRSVLELAKWERQVYFDCKFLLFFALNASFDNR